MDLILLQLLTVLSLSPMSSLIGSSHRLAPSHYILKSSHFCQFRFWNIYWRKLPLQPKTWKAFPESRNCNSPHSRQSQLETLVSLSRFPPPSTRICSDFCNTNWILHRKIPYFKFSVTKLQYVKIFSSDRSSYSDDGLLYIYLSAAPTFSDFHSVPLMQLMLQVSL